MSAAAVPDPAARGGDSPGAPPITTAYARRMRLLVRTAVVATAVALAGFVGLAVTVASHHPGSSSSGAVLPPASSTLGAGDRAPVDFTLARLGGGPALSLASLLHGHPAVVNFFASWCTQCAAELDAFGQAWRHEHQSVVFLGIDTNDYDQARALTMLHAAGADYPVAVDTASDLVTDAYGANGLPTTFFVDSSGRVRFEVLGAESRTVLEARIAALVAGKSPAR